MRGHNECVMLGAGGRTMARRPFFSSLTWLTSEFRLAGSKGKESRKPDCTQHRGIANMSDGPQVCTLET